MLATAPPGRLHMLRLMLAARLRAQASYRGSLVMDGLSQLLWSTTEFVELYVLLHNVPVFGGMALAQASVVYGLCALSFGLADLAFGQLDVLNRRIKSGQLEVLLLRPTPLLLQLVTDDIQLRRLGRVTFGLVAYLVALGVSPIAWRPATVLLAVLAPLAGWLLFGAFFVGAGCLAFWVLDGQQAANMATYGGRYVASMPAGALLPVVRIFFTFVVPATLVAYAPAALITGTPLPVFVWPWMAWAGLPVAVVLWLVLLMVWRAGIRRYTGAGG